MKPNVKEKLSERLGDKGITQKTELRDKQIQMSNEKGAQ